MQGGATLQDQDAQWSTDNHDGHDNAIHGVPSLCVRATGQAEEATPVLPELLRPRPKVATDARVRTIWCIF